MKIYAVLAIIVPFFGCLPKDSCYRNWYRNGTNYRVTPDVRTPEGIAIDTTGHQIDLNRVDSLTTALEQCLERTINRSCFAIYIVNDWYTSAVDAQQQVFTCSYGNGPCESKIESGRLLRENVCRKPPNEPCPPGTYRCGCRGAIQDDFYIIVTPDLRMYTAELARMVTGVNNIWEIANIRQCIVPIQSPTPESTYRNYVTIVDSL
jgi:hypothetical protein